MAETLLSATAITCRPGSQRAVCSSAWRAPSVSFLCRRPRSGASRADGASTVRTGSAQTQLAQTQPAQTQPAQGTGASSITHSQRRPLAPRLRRGRLDAVAVAGAHGIAVEAACADLRTPAPLAGVGEADHDRPLRHQGGNQQQQQPARDGARPATSGRSPCLSARRSTSSPTRASSGSTPDPQRVTKRAKVKVTGASGNSDATFVSLRRCGRSWF